MLCYGTVVKSNCVAEPSNTNYCGRAYASEHSTRSIIAGMLIILRKYYVHMMSEYNSITKTF